MRNAARSGGVALGLLVTLAIVAGSRVPWTPEPTGEAMVRLSWRAVPPSVDDCHVPTEEELAGLPQHMRPAQICEGRAIPFRLRFVLDGRVVVDEQVVGAGARGDRPMYVFHEYRIDPGPHRIEVDFRSEGNGEEEEEEEEAAAGSYLVEDVELGPLEIVLVTRGADGALILR